MYTVMERKTISLHNILSIRIDLSIVKALGQSLKFLSKMETNIFPSIVSLKFQIHVTM